MKVGDLVYLNKDQFYEHDEYIGVILEAPSGCISYFIWWSDGRREWLYEEELEVIDESR